MFLTESPNQQLVQVIIGNLIEFRSVLEKSAFNLSKFVRIKKGAAILGKCIQYCKGNGEIEKAKLWAESLIREINLIVKLKFFLSELEKDNSNFSVYFISGQIMDLIYRGRVNLSKMGISQEYINGLIKWKINSSIV